MDAQTRGKSGASGDHDVGAFERDHVAGVADGVVRGGATRAERQGVAPHSQAAGDLGGAGAVVAVEQACQAGATIAALEKSIVRGERRTEPSERCADGNANPAWFRVGDADTGIVQRAAGGRNAV
jgi:hypothetical protein